MAAPEAASAEPAKPMTLSERAAAAGHGLGSSAAGVADAGAPAAHGAAEVAAPAAAPAAAPVEPGAVAGVQPTVPVAYPVDASAPAAVAAPPPPAQPAQSGPGAAKYSNAPAPAGDAAQHAAAPQAHVASAGAHPAGAAPQDAAATDGAGYAPAWAAASNGAQPQRYAPAPPPLPEPAPSPSMLERLSRAYEPEDDEDALGPDASQAARIRAQLNRKWQILLDRSHQFTTYRWAGFAAVMFIYALRVYLLDGWYIVTYGLGIYLLNMLIGFLSPPVDPETDGPMLPTTHNEEFRPFMRRVPEFHFWYGCTKATAIALVMTFFDVFNIPVFWPILLFYFIVLFGLTMKRQIKHMIKYKYLPWTQGKPTFKGKK